MSRTLLHVVTDWPGHFPYGAATVAALVEAGADVNARFRGPHEETPLHWAASSDDVDVLDALLDAGADIEAPGAVIGGGTPLADATAFRQWTVALRLVERGARATLADVAALGLAGRVEEYFAAASPPTADEVSRAFWAHVTAPAAGGRVPAHRGAEVNWIPPWEDLTPLDAAARQTPAARTTASRPRCEVRDRAALTQYEDPVASDLGVSVRGTCTAARNDQGVKSRWARAALSHRICTGISRRRLGKLISELAGP